MISRELELHRFNTHSESRVQMATGRMSEHVFRYGGNIGLHAIVGGVDVKGPQLIEVSSDGHFKAGPFLTMGSGSLAAMAILETGYRDGMTSNPLLDAYLLKPVQPRRVLRQPEFKDNKNWMSSLRKDPALKTSGDHSVSNSSKMRG